MKKLLVLSLGAGLASATLPAVIQASYLDNVGVYAAGTYTKPSNNGLSIGHYQTHFPAQPLNRFDRAVFLSPEFNWDYALGLSFRFPCSETRFFAEYDYFNATDTRTIGGLSKFPVSPAALGQGVRLSTQSTANVMETSREWRLGLRHWVEFGPRFSVDFSAFFEYDRINISLHQWIDLPVVNRGTEGFIDGNTISYYEQNTKFEGWGPGVGFKLIGTPIACCPAFNLFASFASTLFYANNLADVFQVLEVFPTGFGFAQNLLAYSLPENTHSILAKLDIHFGVDYARNLCLFGDQYSSGITLGVRYMNIFNAFKNANVGGFSIISKGAATANQFVPVSVPNDWGRVGPYLQFRVGGCNA